jgi:hypothetical protein
VTKTTITMLPDPHGFSVDPLTDILCAGARNLIQQAVEAELSMLLATHSKSHAYEIVAMVPRRFASHRRSCRPICAMPNLSKSAQCQIYRRSAPLAIFRKLWPLCWGRTRPVCHPRPFHGSRQIGGMTTIAGNVAISVRAGSRVFGPTVSTFALEWLRKNSVFWSSLAQTNGATNEQRY